MKLLEKLALDISDDHPVDWNELESQFSGEQARVVRQLRVISEMSQIGRTIRTAPTRWDGFEILGRLGEGAFSEVFRARDPMLDREIALKLIDAAASDDADSMCLEGQREAVDVGLATDGTLEDHLTRDLALEAGGASEGELAGVVF